MFPSTPLFTKTFDFLKWLTRMTNHFPRSRRFDVTKRLMDAALDFQEHILEANARRGKMRSEKLKTADVDLDKVRVYLRLSYQLEWMTEGQYNHAANLVTELGKLTGAWRKGTDKK